MSMQDPISDLLTRIRNASRANHESVVMPSSQKKKAICEVLKQEGYIATYSDDGAVKPQLTVRLKYHRGSPVIEEIKRVSRPGLRIYRASDELPQVRGGLGVALVSTNKGILTDRAARAANVGGEVLCTVF
ncbi:MAG: 30S ribosomal protein S8 [Pseudomonadaceae bacterium]|nr:30S ribosomal protein S8 [Pseudomonadaceae bacterium]